MQNNKKYLNPLTGKEKVLASLLAVILFSMVLYIISQAEYTTIDIFKRINSGSYYVEATKMGPLFILGIPLFLGLILMLILRVCDKLTFETSVRITKFVSIFALLGIIGTFILWPFINHQLDKHNYRYCFFYTGSNMFSPPVYVKDSKYCFKGSRSVTNELFAWFDEQEAAGVELTPLEVKQKIDALKEEKGTDW